MSIFVSGLRIQPNRPGGFPEQIMDTITIAKRMTAKVAALKDWRVRSMLNRIMRGIAREWMPQGYMIMTADELRRKYPLIYDGHGCVPFIWAIGKNVTNRRIDFIPFNIECDADGKIVCPVCGGRVVEDEPTGHESGGNFITPPMFEIDNYNYHCRDCGFEIQTKYEL